MSQPLQGPGALYALKERLESHYRLADRLASLSFEHYLNQVVINSAPEPRRFADLAEPWQWDQARALAPAIEAVTAIRKGYRGKRAFWRTMPRGHDKSSSIGRLLNWALAYSAKQFSAVVAASDREQASLIMDFMQAEARLNPWLNKRINFKIGKVEGRNNSTLKVIAADAFGSFGLNNDILIMDEVTHWSDEKLWGALMSGTEKRPGSLIFVITNAGVLGTWQWNVREVARTDSSWHFYEAPGPMASWMNSERSQAMLKMLPETVVRRVFRNEWLDPAEECGYVTRREAARCAELGSARGLTLQERALPDVEYVAGIDYGPKKDRTVLTVGHRKGEEFLIDQMVVWQGKDFPGLRVPIEKVEEWIEKTYRAFPGVIFVIDQYQMEGTIQKYSGVCRIERFEPRAGKANYEMAQIVRNQIVNDRMLWYPGCGDVIAVGPSGLMTLHTLVDEFAELVIKTTAAGYRMDHLSGKHDDRVVSLGMACWRAMGGMRRRPFTMDERYF